MRVTVAHNKTKEEAMRIVDRASEDLFKGAAGPVQITDQKKTWNGSTMSFSFVGKMGFFHSGVSGSVDVTDKDVTIDCELPGAVKHFMPEEKIRAAVDNKVKGLLNA